MRTGRSLWMALDRKNWQLAVLHALDALIVEIETGNFQLTWQRTGLDTPTVVLGRNENPPTRLFLDGLVGATMTKFEAKNFSAKSQTENLVAQTNAKDRLFTYELFARFNRVI